MTTKKIYGPWIKWHGGECPVPPETMVKVKFRRGDSTSEHPASDYCWRHYGEDHDTVEYCIVTEQADLDAAEQLLRANGYTITPPAKPLTFEDVRPLTEAPPKGTKYWSISVAKPDGVYRVTFDNDEFDRRVIERRMAYLEKEHALIAARHIFGLKGGEL